MTNKLVDTKEAGQLIGLKKKKFILQMVKEDRLEPENFDYYHDTNGYLFVRDEVLQLPEKFPNEYRLAKLLDGDYKTLTETVKSLNLNKSKLISILNEFEIPLEEVKNSRNKYFISNDNVKRIEELIKSGQIQTKSVRQQNGFQLFQAVKYEGNTYRIIELHSDGKKISIIKHGAEEPLVVRVSEITPTYSLMKSENKKRSRLFSKVQIPISSIFGDGGSLIDILYMNLPKNYIRISYHNENEKILIQIMHHAKIDMSTFTQKEKEQISEAMQYFNYKKLSGQVGFSELKKTWEFLSDEKLITISLPKEVIEFYDNLAKDDRKTMSAGDFIERKLISDTSEVFREGR